LREKLLLKNDLFAERMLLTKTRGEKFRLSAVMAGNLIIVGWYSLVSLPVLLGLRLEALTGESYAWPLRVMLISLFVLFFSLILLAATFKAWKRRHFLKVTAACLATLAVLELYESAMLHITYGPLQLNDVSVYIRGPLLVVWAALNVMHKPKNGVTAES